MARMSHNPSFQHGMGPSRTRSAQGLPAGASPPREKRSRRVLFITRKWGPAVGGMETYCERLSEELAKSHRIEVVALRGRSNGLPPSALALLLFPFTVLRRLLTLATKPDIIHCGDMAIWPLGLLARGFFPRARVVLSAHGTDVAYGARGGIRGSLYSAYLALGSKLLRGAGVIANSRATQSRVQGIGWTTIAMVPLATDLRANGPRAHHPGTILFVGRLIKQKGCSWFVREVLPHLPEPLTLSIIGTRWDPREDEVLDHARVRFLGPKRQSELIGHYAQAACVIVPNIELANGEYEGFGLVATEAASAGGLVLAAATGGLTDAVVDGETGFLLPPGDAPAWARKISEISRWSDARRAEFLTRSQAAAQRHFSWARVAEETAAAYRNNEAS